ncbi:hypothetical protein Aple_010390 [Acrocarpospora pleiomorpha]|uniref:Uncharacterized protein n=1 Tax=Acrocarpospora pleiomorpha TaxID=90975 RepID=A0A5M3XAH8_9ACTN|nr:hypothetical protein [Acrocarpospora pleiomorpha]GES18144.1 hypothetical protein Aple_010390 [Acrocarpospora pleiomorpha]
MMINRSGRRLRGSPAVERPAVERPALRMCGGRPVASLLLHGEDDQDAELGVTDMDEADALVSAAVAMRAQLAVALNVNALAGD